MTVTGRLDPTDGEAAPRPSRSGLFIVPPLTTFRVSSGPVHVYFDKLAVTLQAEDKTIKLIEPTADKNKPKPKKK